MMEALAAAGRRPTVYTNVRRYNGAVQERYDPLAEPGRHDGFALAGKNR
jgi:hypothetical protein